MYLTETMYANLSYIIDSTYNPSISDINGLTLSALMARNCVDVYVVGRGKTLDVKVKATPRGKHLYLWYKGAKFTPYKECLKVRRGYSDRLQE